MIDRFDKLTNLTNRTGPTFGQFVFTSATLFIVLVIIYTNSFHASWHYDDFTNIVENKNIHLKELSWGGFQNSFL